MNNWKLIDLETISIYLGAVVLTSMGLYGIMSIPTDISYAIGKAIAGVL